MISDKTLIGFFGALALIMVVTMVGFSVFFVGGYMDDGKNLEEMRGYPMDKNGIENISRLCDEIDVWITDDEAVDDLGLYCELHLNGEMENTTLIESKVNDLERSSSWRIFTAVGGLDLLCCIPLVMCIYAIFHDLIPSIKLKNKISKHRVTMKDMLYGHNSLGLSLEIEEFKSDDGLGNYIKAEDLKVWDDDAKEFHEICQKRGEQHFADMTAFMKKYPKYEKDLTDKNCISLPIPIFPKLLEFRPRVPDEIFDIMKKNNPDIVREDVNLRYKELGDMAMAKSNESMYCMVAEALEKSFEYDNEKK